MNKLSVVIPVYYNEGSLPVLHQELAAVEDQLRALDVEMEWIFVDDGSGDQSLAELVRIKNARPTTRVVKLARNFGAVHASKAGLQLVSGDCFLILAADLQDPPALIPDLVRRWKQGAKFVMCVREKRSDPPASIILAWLYYRMLRLFVIRDYPDGGYDLALMDRAFLPYMRSSGKNINPNVFAFWLGFRPEVIRYERRRREHGRSRWTLAKKWKFFLDTILGFSIVPLRMMTGIGVLVALGSFTFSVFVVINGLLGRYEVPGFATLASLLSFLFGLVIGMLGILGEYLWRIFDQVNGRPEFVIEEIL